MRKISGRKALSLIAGAIAAANLSMGAVSAMKGGRQRQWILYLAGNRPRMFSATGMRSVDVIAPGNIIGVRGRLAGNFWCGPDGFSNIVSEDGWEERVENVSGVAVLRRNGIWYVAGNNAEGVARTYAFNREGEIGGTLKARASADDERVLIVCSNTSERGPATLILHVDKGSNPLHPELDGTEIESGMPRAREIAARLNEMIARQEHSDELIDFNKLFDSDSDKLFDSDSDKLFDFD